MIKCVNGVCILALYGLSTCGLADLEFDKVQNPTINTDFALPLGSISYSIKDLTEDIGDEVLEVVEGDEFSLSFIYRDTTEYSDHDALIEIGDVTNFDTYSPVTSDISSVPTAASIPLPSKDFEFEIEATSGERIDSVFFKGGTLEYTLSSDFDFLIDYVFTLTDIRDESNQPVTFSRFVASSSSDFQSRSLAGLKNVSTPIGGSNIFNVNLQVTLQVPANTTVRADDKITIDLVLKNPVISGVFGDFGNDPIDVQENSIEISAFEDAAVGELEIAMASISMEIDNRYGIEMGMSMAGVKAIDSDLNEINLSGTVVDALQFVDAPNSSQIGEIVSSTVTIDQTNSNILDLINSLPSSMVFNVTAEPNPPGSDNENNFLFDDQMVEIRTIMEIPFEFKMDGFSKDITMSSPGSDLEAAESLEIHVNTSNEIPFNGTLDLSFTNGDGDTIYVLPDIGIIESPDIGSDGRTIGSSDSSASIVLDEEGLNAFLESDEIIATIKIFTFESALDNHVKMFSDYQLDIDLAVSGKISVEL
ncbi:MAG: hypothetical protein GY816_10375 [Cytophagales bacterium]|nr:hypothetical protein [Cytophagales bacterium]